MATSRFSPDSGAGPNILDQLNIGRATKKQQDFWSARTPDSVDGHGHGINTPDPNSGRPQWPRRRNRDRRRTTPTPTTTSTTHSNNATTDDHDHHHHDQHNNSSSSNSASGGGTRIDSGGDGGKETEIHLPNGSGSSTDGTYDVHDGDGDHDNHEDHDDHEDHDEHGRQHDHNTDHEGFSCQPTSNHGQTMAPGSKSQEDKVATTSREDTNTERAATTEITPEEDSDSLNHGASRAGGTFEFHEKGDIVISLPGNNETSSTEGKSKNKGKGSNSKNHSENKNRGDDEDDASHNDDGDQDEGGGDDDDEHGHRKGLCEGETSSQHNTYIQQHLEELQKKCDEFHECTIELYKAENFHRVLAGEPIQLSNICGLMYPDGEEMYKNGNESVKCSEKERDAIRQDIGRRLSSDMVKDKNGWERLDDCLEKNRTAKEPAIDTLCGLTKKETILCGSNRIHNKAEEFFNHEMEHLHCSCAAIREQKTTTEGSSPKLPLNIRDIRIAVVTGVLSLIVILIIVVIVLCFRHRKVKKRLSQHRMKYLPSPHDEGSAIYQEINDCPPGLRNGKNEGNISGGYHFLGRAPSLPERYVKPQMARPRNNPNSPGEEEREYLEPLPDTGSGRRTPPAARANMGYGAPKDLAVVEPPYDLARNPANMSPTDGRPPKESNYFERLQPMNSVEDDGGYSTLGRKRVPPEEAHDDEVGAEESADGRQYFVLEPQDDAASEKDALTMVNSDASEFSGVQTAL